MGIIGVLSAPIHTEKGLWKEGTTYKLYGKVKEVRENEYSKWLTLKDVHYKRENKWYPLRSHIQLNVPLKTIVTEADEIATEGERLEDTVQMNPSDFDTVLYLKGEKIGASFKAGEDINIYKRTTWSEKIKEEIRRKVKGLYNSDHEGILLGCLLGETELIKPSIRALYNTSGIGHVLAISGFHVGLIMAFLFFLLNKIPLNYVIRQIGGVAGIGLYAFLTGCSTSTMRATLMLSIILLGKCLWQEEDKLTSLAAAALIILIINPYQIFQVGFQLSFSAMLAIIFCLEIIQRKERESGHYYSKLMKALLLLGAVQLGTYPIMAYHFFQVPFLISFINLMIIPIFSYVIIGGWLSVLSPNLLGEGIAYLVGMTLQGVLELIKGLLKCPLAIICTGRPLFLDYIIYAVVVVILIMRATQRKIPLKRVQLMVGISLFYLVIRKYYPSPLKITGLYVGQGDSVVIETPHHQVVVIDGGNKGQGDTVERFIKYEGNDQVAALLLSHSDADHITGLIEVLEDGLKVKHLFISISDESPLLEQLKKVCSNKGVKVTELKRGEVLLVDGVTLTCLAPVDDTPQESLNECSMIQLLRYKNFTALFTGDKSYPSKQELALYNGIAPLTLLKVSHHGSVTGTNQGLLLKLQPSYAMISCGKNNRYGHPHDEVVEMIEERNILLSRTDEEGAIYYKTDGKVIKKASFRKEVPGCQ